MIKRTKEVDKIFARIEKRKMDKHDKLFRGELRKIRSRWRI